MLRDRRDAVELLELLDFHPPDWRRYYEDLWSRYPTLAEGWIHVGFLNLPTTHVPEKWERDLKERRRRVVEKREHQDLLMIATIRGKVLGLIVTRGADRARAQQALDRRLADFGLRPIFPGGTHIPKSERPAMKKRYQELQRLIDELRTAASDADTTEPRCRLALLIRFPLFSEQEIDLIFRYPYPRRGATADAAMAVLARRFNTKSDTLDRYLFPRSAKK
jgi:hypothetical protein